MKKWKNTVKLFTCELGLKKTNGVLFKFLGSKAGSRGAERVCHRKRIVSYSVSTTRSLFRAIFFFARNLRNFSSRGNMWRVAECNFWFRNMNKTPLVFLKPSSHVNNFTVFFHFFIRMWKSVFSISCRSQQPPTWGRGQNFSSQVKSQT
jgi:hypothetical protein